MSLSNKSYLQKPKVENQTKLNTSYFPYYSKQSISNFKKPWSNTLLCKWIFIISTTTHIKRNWIIPRRLLHFLILTVSFNSQRKCMSTCLDIMESMDSNRNMYKKMQRKKQLCQNEGLSFGSCLWTLNTTLICKIPTS